MNRHRLLLCLGSNVNQTRNMETARELLCQLFGHVVFSRFLWTKPIGHVSPPYLNALAYARTDLSYDEANRMLKDIERRLGRTHDDKSKHQVTIDIDILQHDETKYHLKDWERTYVIQLIGELNTALSE